MSRRLWCVSADLGLKEDSSLRIASPVRWFWVVQLWTAIHSFPWHDVHWMLLQARAQTHNKCLCTQIMNCDWMTWEQ